MFVEFTCNEKLQEAGKNNMVDTYYNVILKYLFGKSLLEIDESLDNNLVIIFKLRNDLMHIGELNSKSYKKVGFKELNHEACEIIIEKLQEVIFSTSKMIRPLLINSVSTHYIK